MKYCSELTEMLHAHAADLHDAGFIDKQTMAKFDRTCLTPIHPLTGEDIRQIRQAAQFSQTVFANYLNVSKNLVSDWERGVKKPSGTALKLLTLAQTKGIQAIA